MSKRHTITIYLALLVALVAVLCVIFVIFPNNQAIITKIIIASAIFVISIIFAVFANKWVTKKMEWYEELLNSIPFPISVTDMEMNWTFINKPVEDFLDIKIADALGKPCENWGAGICNTSSCGINCLRSGKERTFFNQHDMDFQVDVHYLHDAKGKEIGHIEVVQDISNFIKASNAQLELISKIDLASKAFVSASQKIASEALALTHETSEQAETAEDLSAAIRKVSTQTKENADMAARAAELAVEIRNGAEEGTGQMARMTQAVEDISQASKSIGNVIKVIDDIAFQTNILALNAAVEAARAGQHGKGFAVVADEVRSLASKSAESARNTAALIESSVEKASVGVNISVETATALDKIVSGINESVSLINSIADASEMQAITIASIDSGVDKFERIVRQNSETAEHSLDTAEKISNEASLLQSLIDDFTTNDIEH